MDEDDDKKMAPEGSVELGVDEDFDERVLGLLVDLGYIYEKQTDGLDVFYLTELGKRTLGEPPQGV